MGAVLNDNGGEFTGEEIKEVKDILNVVDLTTGAESPWQNGLCEKNHHIVDTMLERLIDDYPDSTKLVQHGEELYAKRVWLFSTPIGFWVQSKFAKHNDQ